MATKTLRVMLADILGPAGPGARVHGEVWARAVDANGAPREIRYTDGTLVTMAAPRVPLNPAGYADFVVVPNDDASVHVDDRGFGIQVGWDLTIRGPRGAVQNVTNTGKTVAITTASPAIAQYGLLATYVPIIIGTSYITQGTADGRYEEKLSTYRAVGSGDERSALNTFLAASTPLGVKRVIGALSVSDSITVAAGSYLDLTAATITQTGSSKTTLLPGAGATIVGGSIVGKGSDYVSGSGGAPTAIGCKVIANGVTVTGTKFTNHGGAGIYVGACSGFRASSVSITGLGSPTIPANDSSQFGVYINTGCTNVSLSQLEVSNTSIGVIASNDTTHLTLTALRIHDIPGQHGIYLQNGTGLNIAGVDVWSANLNGVKVQMGSSNTADSFGMSITNVTANSCTDTALIVYNTESDLTSAKKYRGVTISNVAAYNCGRAAYLGSLRGATVNNIAGHSCGTDGVTVMDCQDTTVSNVSILGAGWRGILFTTQTGSSTARVKFANVKIRDAAGLNAASAKYGVQVSGVTGSDGVDLTFDGLEVTSTNGFMDYAFYVPSGDQETLTLRNATLKDGVAQDIRLAAGPRFIKEMSNVRYVSSLNLPVMSKLGAAVSPAVHGLVGMAYDPMLATTTQSTMTAGVLYVTKVQIPNEAKLSTVWFGLNVVGATLTAGQNLIGVYDSAGTLIAQTGDASSTLSGSTGNKSIALSSPVTVPAGAFVHVGILFNGTTSPQLRGVTGTALPNIALTTAAQSRFATGGTSQTSLPGTLPTLTAANGATSAPWFGLA